MKPNADFELQDNEKLGIVNMETNAIKYIEKRANNIPEGMSKLDYTHFAIVNEDIINDLSKLLTNEEMGIIYKMIQKAEFCSNSLAPLSEECTVRELSEEFNVNKNRITAVLANLYKIGVYLEIKVHEDQPKAYWVLNPHISWKGKLKNDSIFYHFRNTIIAKLSK